MKRHLMFVLWAGLFLVGCMAQLSMLPGAPSSGANDVATQYVKPQVYGNAQWQPGGKGKGTLDVRLAPLIDPLANRAGFRVKTLPLAQVSFITARITAADIAIPITPSGGATVAVTSGIIPALSFPSVPVGTGRVLTIQGLDGGQNPLPGIKIGAVFDVGTTNAGFEVSPRTSPAAQVYSSLTTGVAATVNVASLNAFLDSITVPVGGSFPYSSYTTHPILVDTTSLASAITANSGSTTGLTAASFRVPRAKVAIAVNMDAVPAPGEMPTIYLGDPASPPVVVPFHTIGDASPLNFSVGTSVSGSINAQNKVTLTFSSIAATSATGWSLGVKHPGDGNAAPQAKYYDQPANTYGHSTVALVNNVNATNAQTVTPTFTLPPLDPKYVPGQIRWRNATTAGTIGSQDISANLVAALSTGGLLDTSSSADLMVFVGASTSPYVFSGTLNLSNSAIVMQGPPGPNQILGPNRPRLVGSRVQLNASTNALRDLRVSSGTVALAAGGELSRVTVEGYSIASGSVAAITGTGTVSLQNVHVYNVVNNGTSGADAVHGIYLDGSASGTLQNVLVDDRDDAGAASNSVRFAASSSGVLAGIRVVGSTSVDLTNCQVIALGRAAPMTIAKAFGIWTDQPAGRTITNCTVANNENTQSSWGIKSAADQIQNCEVRDLAQYGATSFINGVEIGKPGVTATLLVQSNRLVRIGSSTAPVSSSNVFGISAWAPDSANSVTVSNNTIAESGGITFSGITLANAGGTGSPVINVQNNLLVNNGTGVNSSTFEGIGTTGSLKLGTLNIVGNAFNGNLWNSASPGGAQLRAISTYANSGTVNVTDNRFFGNTVAMSAGAGGIVTFLRNQDFGTSVTNVRRNVFKGNNVSNSSGAAFHSIFNNVQNSQPKLFENNVFAGNTMTSGAAGSSLDMIYTMDGATIASNRIYSNTFTGAGLSGSSVSAINLYAPAGQSVVIRYNVVAEPDLGQAALNRIIEMNNGFFCGVVVTHNSFWMGNSQSFVIDDQTGTGSGGTLNLVDNVFGTTFSAGATSQAVRAFLTPTTNANTAGRTGTAYGSFLLILPSTTTGTAAELVPTGVPFDSAAMGWSAVPTKPEFSANHAMTTTTALSGTAFAGTQRGVNDGSGGLLVEPF